ncbi:hypothetical protein EV421DRAFT_1744531 [Armillaria borealis]|uniref:Uncharacterized protein n=1 Tax=Armillaria borealis TaxID=47425 RepID=A0AA39IV14_9AGAR|nr:hypothetical protein EV421DRAFT_1744531 [Armillaria borealis]
MVVRFGEPLNPIVSTIVYRVHQEKDVKTCPPVSPFSMRVPVTIPNIKILPLHSAMEKPSRIPWPHYAISIHQRSIHVSVCERPSPYSELSSFQRRATNTSWRWSLRVGGRLLCGSIDMTLRVDGYTLFERDCCFPTVVVGYPHVKGGTSYLWMGLLCVYNEVIHTGKIDVQQPEGLYGYFLTVCHGTFWVLDSDDGLVLGGAERWMIHELRPVVQRFSIAQSIAKSHPVIQWERDAVYLSGVGVFRKALAACTRVCEIVYMCGSLNDGWGDNSYSLGAEIASQVELGINFSQTE